MKLQTDNLGKVAITVEKDYWNINKRYDKLVAVEREGYGAYLSRKPVPEGTYIDNREYWIRLGFPGSSGSVNLVQTLGYDAGVAISQKAITEKFDEIEAILNDIISGGIITTVTFNPPSVYVNESTEIIIGVEVNIEADKISIFRGNVKIGEDGSGTVYSVSDIITPNSDVPIIYRVKVEKNGKIVSNVTATLPIDKADGLVKWMRGGNEVTEDTVTVLETGHIYPTLYNPDELIPISYTSSNTSVARVTKVNDYSYKIDIVSFGSTDIHAIFSGDTIYNAIDIAYRLVVSKVDYEDFVWTDPQTGNSIMNDPTWEINKSNLPNVIYPVLKRTGDRGTVTYSTSPEQSNIASINSVTGNITLGTALGTVVINAKFSGDNTYEAKTVSYSLTVQQQSEVYWTNGSTRQNTFEYFATESRKNAYLSNDGHINITYKLYEVYGGSRTIVTQIDKETDTIIDYGYPSYIKIHKDTGRVELPRGLSNQLVSSDHYNIDAIPNGGEAVTLDVIIKRGTANFKWSKDAETVNVGTFVDGVYTIPSEQLPHIIADDESREIAYVDNIRQQSEHMSTMVQVEHSKNTENTYTVKVIDTNIPQEGIEVQIEAYNNSNVWTYSRSKVYALTILPPVTPDYYVGWATGENADYDVIEEMSGDDLADNELSQGYNSLSTPSKTKTITQGDLVGDFQILFVMWKTSNPPVSGAFYGGIAEEQLVASDFLNANKFPAQSNVTINGDTFHLAGRGGSYEAGQYLKVNF